MLTISRKQDATFILTRHKMPVRSIFFTNFKTEACLRGLAMITTFGRFEHSFTRQQHCTIVLNRGNIHRCASNRM